LENEQSMLDVVRTSIIFIGRSSEYIFENI